MEIIPPCSSPFLLAQASKPLSFTLGIGCRAACTPAQLDAFISAQLNQAAIAFHDIAALATWAPRQNHPALIALAKTLDLALNAYATDALHAVESRLHHHSPSLFARTGVYGIAESAALCAADAVGTYPGQIVLPRQNTTVATMALARIHNA